MVTMKVMCEYIVDKMKIKDSNWKLTAEQLFNSSPTGELFHIILLYNDLKVQEGKINDKCFRCKKRIL